MSKRHVFSASISIAILFFVVAVPQVFAQTKPVVVSTNPPDLATGVSPGLASFSITFSKPMNTGYGGPFTNGWPSSTWTWSADQKTFTSTRTDLSTPLTAGITMMIYLNLPGTSDSTMFRDTEGNYLDYYKFSFTIQGGNAGLNKIPADPAKGFSWPYYLYIPPTIKTPTVLLVQPNNTGSVDDDPAVHDASARNLIEGTRFLGEDLGSPYLVPTFPRPASLPVGYTHALDRDVLLTTVPGYNRIDLQLIAMIEDARRILSEKGITVGPKVFAVGVSASGSFVSRFTILHPDRIKAASFGAPGFGPIVPVASWNGQALPYPEGISDLNSLIGSSFNSTEYQQVPIQAWVGDEDTNVDPWWDPSDPEVARIIAAFGGRHLYSRWPRYDAAYYSVTSLAQFVVFPGLGHQWASWSFIEEFFNNNRSNPQPPLPKPLQYKVFFPQVASFDTWETEIALVNTIPGGTSVRGELQAFRETGGDPLEVLPIEIPPGGRKEITVGQAFVNPAQIAYIIFHSDSGFLAGYTRFNQPGNRVSLPATPAVKEGWFPKMEQDGWTGLAFVNVSDEKANVVLRAFDENGNLVTEELFPELPSGQKKIGLLDQVFHTDLRNARYFYFSSDQNVIAFTVSGSSDGQMLDGIPALGWYLK
jgi:pimeloyl-ACP methyl ester carboxylesterase